MLPRSLKTKHKRVAFFQGSPLPLYEPISPLANHKAPKPTQAWTNLLQCPTAPPRLHIPRIRPQSQLRSRSAPHATPPLARFCIARRRGRIRSQVGPIKPSQRKLCFELRNDPIRQPGLGRGPTMERGRLRSRTRCAQETIPGAPHLEFPTMRVEEPIRQAAEGAIPECNRNTQGPTQGGSSAGI